MKLDPFIGVFAAAIALAAPSHAQQPVPLAHGDAKAGRTLADRDCIACHARNSTPPSSHSTPYNGSATSTAQV